MLPQSQLQNSKDPYQWLLQNNANFAEFQNFGKVEKYLRIGAVSFELADLVKAFCDLNYDPMEDPLACCKADYGEGRDKITKVDQRRRSRINERDEDFKTLIAGQPQLSGFTDGGLKSRLFRLLRLMQQPMLGSGTLNVRPLGEN